MKLTKSADFALRLMVYLASYPSVHIVSYLAKTLAIPYNNLAKIVQLLSRSGLLYTHKGKNGGVELGKPASEITLHMIIGVVDGPTQLVECSRWLPCTQQEHCKIKTELSRLQVQIDGLMHQVKLISLI